MVEPHIPEINIDEVMKKIREEVSRRKAQRNEGDQHAVMQQEVKATSINSTVKQTRPWRAIKAIQFRLRRYPFYGFAYRTALRLTRFIPKYQTSFAIEDFLKYDDEAFIKNAYKGILLREADEQGLSFYLSMMRNGRLNKIQVLANLRYSKEGKEKKINISGLFVPYIATKLYRIPVFGYAIRWTTAIIKMPLIVRNITAFENYTNTLSHELEQKADAQAVQTDINNIIQQIRDQKLNILSQQKNLSSLLERLNQKVSEGHSDKGQKGLTEEQAHQYDALYVSFEDRFRGTQADIKERQGVYLPYIKEALKNTDNAMVLDVGCGRGEWLELLKEQKINAKGIDINRIMVAQAKEFGLDVEEADVVEYLKNQKNNILSAITGFHIVEHLPFEVMIKLFDESLRVLKTGGTVIFETPNPENLMVGAYTFYYDPTHLHPIPPDTLKFVAEARGFTNVRILRLHRRNEQTSSLDEPLHEFIERMDMEQDYAIVGYKG
jgi:O-antigen chain-terminating methyltransferase